MAQLQMRRHVILQLAAATVPSIFGDKMCYLKLNAQIVVWKVVHQNNATVLQSNMEDHVQVSANGVLLHYPKYTDVLISKLIGHEGSIFGIAWFPNGLKLVSVSDDRSAQI